MNASTFNVESTVVAMIMAFGHEKTIALLRMLGYYAYDLFKHFEESPDFKRRCAVVHRCFLKNPDHRFTEDVEDAIVEMIEMWGLDETLTALDTNLTDYCTRNIISHMLESDGFSFRVRCAMYRHVEKRWKDQERSLF